MSLHQVPAKRGLATCAGELRALVIDELVKRHWNYNVEICNTFERLRDRALNVPRTTRELLELGELFSPALLPMSLRPLLTALVTLTRCERFIASFRRVWPRAKPTLRSLVEWELENSSSLHRDGKKGTCTTNFPLSEGQTRTREE